MLKSNRSTIKSLALKFKFIILNQKLLTVGIAIIGLGVGLVKAGSEIQKAGLVKAGSEIQKAGLKIKKVDLEAEKAELVKTGSEIEKAGSEIEKVGLKIQKAGPEVEKAELVKAGSKIEKVGLEIKELGSNLINLIKILWPCIAGIGLGVTIGIGLVRFFVLKLRISWHWRAIIDLISIIIGQFLGLVLVSILADKNMILLGIMTGWIGVMMGWYAVLKERMMGMAAVGATILGIILADLAGDELTNAVIDIGQNLPLLASKIDTLAIHTSDNHAALQNLITHTSDNHAALQKVVTHTSANHAALQNLITHTSANHAALQNLITHTSDNHAALQKVVTHTSANRTALQKVVTHTSANHAALQNLITHTSDNHAALQNLITHTSDNHAALQNLVKHTSRIEILFNSLHQKVPDRTLDDKTVQKLEEDIDQISKELDKTNWVRLLIGSEDSLRSKGFLNTDRSIRWLWLKKSHNLSKYLGTDSSSVKMVPIGQAYTLKVQDSLSVKLKRLVSPLGTLKKDKDYTMVENDSTTITFINPLLGRMDILAVVKRQ